MIEVISARIGYREKENETVVFPELDCQIKKGRLYCMLGPNGIGKTTFFRSILGFLPLLSGHVKIDGREVRSFHRKELARTIAYVPQYHTPPFPYTVEEVILMGRGAHIAETASPKKQDVEKAEAIMEELGILELQKRNYTRLSGGERQLVLIARALAQEAGYLLMDEPAANLDYGNQIKMLQILQKLSLKGNGICFTSHNPEHALWSQGEVIALTNRQVLYTGQAEEVLTKEVLEEMYGVQVTVKGEKDEMGQERKILIPVFRG